MSADKMPPPPEREAEFSVNDSGRWTEATKGTPMWTEDSLRAYARAYAAEQTRELVGALEDGEPLDHNPWRVSLENCISGDNYLRSSEYRDLIAELDVLYRLRALIAKHKEQA